MSTLTPSPLIDPLIDPAAWSAAYDARLEAMLSTTDELLRQASAALSAHLSPATRTPAAGGRWRGQRV